jgi:hypothetical protein
MDDDYCPEPSRLPASILMSASIYDLIQMSQADQEGPAFIEEAVTKQAPKQPKSLYFKSFSARKSPVQHILPVRISQNKLIRSRSPPSLATTGQTVQTPSTASVVKFKHSISFSTPKRTRNSFVATTSKPT